MRRVGPNGLVLLLRRRWPPLEHHLRLHLAIVCSVDELDIRTEHFGPDCGPNGKQNQPPAPELAALLLLVAVLVVVVVVMMFEAHFDSTALGVD